MASQDVFDKATLKEELYDYLFTNLERCVALPLFRCNARGRTIRSPRTLPSSVSLQTHPLPQPLPYTHFATPRRAVTELYTLCEYDSNEHHTLDGIDLLSAATQDFASVSRTRATLGGLSATKARQNHDVR
jgi:hypothetical protein